MAETKRGRLGVAELVADTLTSVYAVTDGTDSKASVFISNLESPNTEVLVDVAIVNGAVGDVADEDYLYKQYPLKLGEFLRIDDLDMDATECLCVKASTAGVVVRVFGTEQDAASGSSPALSVQKITSQSLEIGDFTDNEDATGYIDITTPIPAKSIVLGWKAEASEGFAGDTTAVISVGIDGDLDAFSADVTQSVLADAAVAMSAALEASAACVAETTVRVTVTGGADFSSIVTNDTGIMVVEVYYIAAA